VDLVAATRFCLTPLLAELVAATFRRILPAPTLDRIRPQVVRVQLGHPAIRPTGISHNQRVLATHQLRDM